MTDDKQKQVLVLGSSRGIGREIAQQLLIDGFTVCVHGCTDSDSLQDFYSDQKQADRQIHKLFFDVTDEKGSALKLEQHIDAHGSFWGIVYCVGIYRDSIFAGMERSEWQDVLNTSLHGFYNTVQPLTLPMIRLRSGGRIVVLTSVSGIVGNPGQVNYSAAKGALNAACKALSKELASRKITVNAVAPGLIDTDLADFPGKEDMLKQIPMKRMGTPREVASLVRYLLSADAGYITGQILSVNGGLA